MSTQRHWKRDGWTLTADREEVNHDDPGAGTPLLVTAPNGDTGTLNCALGEAMCGDTEIPGRITDWLDGIADEADDWVMENV